MAEDETPPVLSPQGQAPVLVRLVNEIPAVFADSVANHVIGPGIVKFYYTRVDANLEAVNTSRTIPVVQMIMPTSGFIEMVAFFEYRMEKMLEDGKITQKQIDIARDFYRKPANV